MVFKTLVVFKRNPHTDYFWTISFPGHYGTVIMIGTIATIFIGLFQAVTEGNFIILLLAIGSYFITTMAPTEDYRSHHELLQTICKEKEQV